MEILTQEHSLHGIGLVFVENSSGGQRPDCRPSPRRWPYMPLSLQSASTSADFGQTKKVYLEEGLVLVSWEPESHAGRCPGTDFGSSPAVLSEEVLSGVQPSVSTVACFTGS